MNQGLVRVNTALVSVSNKIGIEAFCHELTAINPELKLLATGNTAVTLAQSGLHTTDLSDYTGYPECFDGRVKTLHPRIEGGILFKRCSHEEEAKRLDIPGIDLVVCNLYDFAGTVQKGDVEMIDLLEKLDIGGSTMIRAAAKNFTHVAVVVDPADYLAVVQEMRTFNGSLTVATRARLAAKAMNLSADYDSLIASEFSRRLTGEETMRPKLVKGQSLRYGENPDQQAWVYQLERERGIAQATILNGKALSYNNYEDATAAFQAIQELNSLGAENGVAVIKHGGLCGYACAPSMEDSFRRAWAGDPKSAFGSVIAFGAPVGDELIKEVENRFIEVMIAPAFSSTFVQWAKENKRSLRLLQVPIEPSPQVLFKKISGGMLVQTSKRPQTITSMKPLMKRVAPQATRQIGVVTERVPEPGQENLFNFGMAAVKFAKSNAVAIVIEAEPGCFQLLGMGAGQPNRVDSLDKLAIPKAIENLKAQHESNPNYEPDEDLSNCVLASDGFFPFADSISSAARAGLRNCIQPGGSIRDQEVIEAANQHEMCMIFSGERSFSH